ncbi:MAG: SH3 domain-containing protein [Chloroflexi bacterium]|nr:SH3 domain-containing protein [Chloroflexota bacterium]
MRRKIWVLVIVVTLLAVFQTVAAQGVVWTGQYYNNAFLLGQPNLTRQDAAVAFDWGAGAPAPGLNSDGFTVRWGADPYFPAGTYRFWALADDEVRVNVGFAFNPQIDTFGNPKVGQIVWADVTLTEGVHHVQVDYRESAGQAYVYVTWANLATNPTGPNFPVPQSVSGVGLSPWTAQYYGNVALAGEPVLIQSEAGLSHDWGAGSPLASIPADNFSARWTSLQTVDAGTYQISVRVDDGVRVFVNGVAVINQWGPANAVTHVAVVTLPAGTHNFMVEYFEAGGNALIEFSLQRQGVVAPPVVSPPTSATGTVVTAFRLNVRSAPNVEGNILVKINRGETYPVIGRNADSTWWQLNVNGTPGWVFGRFLDVSNPSVVPVTDQAESPLDNQPPATGFSATPVATVNIRSGPSTQNAILGQIARGISVPVVGRTANYAWWQVNYGGITGWVSARFAPLDGTASADAIPITAP